MNEKTIQRLVANHFRDLEAALKTFTFFAVSGGSVRLPVHIAKQLKDSGVRSGVHDLIFLGEGEKTILIELKTPDGSLSESQKIFHGIVKKLGFGSFCIYVKDDVDAIKQITGILRAHGFKL